MSGATRLTIVHVDTGQGLRGGQHQLLLLAQALRQHGHEQLIVCPEASPLEGRARSEDFPTYSLPGYDPAHLHGVLLLRRRLQAQPPKIIHAHDGAGQSIAWLATAGTAAKRVASRRVTFAPRRRLDYRLKYTYTCHAVIAISDFVKRIGIGAGVPEEKIEVIHDGVEIPSGGRNLDARRRVRAEWGFTEADFVIGHVGAFMREKGQDIAVGAFSRLAEALPQARLVLAGDGYEKAGALLAPIGDVAGRRIRFLGYQEKLAPFFAGLDLYVMPSRSEGLGSSALLAMAHGLPVVATRAGGLPEVVEEGKNGWLVEPESAASLADALASAAADLARLAAFGASARRRAENFSVGKMAGRTEALYFRLLGHARPLESAAELT